MFFVRGHIFGNVAMVRAHELSSKTLQCTHDTLFFIHTPCSESSSKRLISRVVVLSPSLKVISAASVELKAVSVCILDSHVMGQPVYFTM